MKGARFVLVLATVVFLFLVTTSIAQDSTASLTPPSSGNIASIGDGGKDIKDHHHYRRHVSHSHPSNTTMEDKLKEFAGKLGKTPDDLRAAFGKYMLAHGVSVEKMQEGIQQGYQIALQMVESIKKAMRA